MNHYVGTKIVQALLMDRGTYNLYRGWQLPANENGADEGYLVEYTDGGAPNDSRHKGYISWSPREQFDAAYIDIGTNVERLAPHELRVLGERAALNAKVEKLAAFLRSNVAAALLREELDLLLEQATHMTRYLNILDKRVSRCLTR
jgi:hypothetical protein